jgi:REP element-mobilizing transposase RayT
MSTKRQIAESSGIYFITITCYKWLSLFEITSAYDSVYKWFDYLKQQGHFITGYVIMPNHLHALLAFKQPVKSINSIIGNASVLWRMIVKRLELATDRDTLNKLTEGVSSRDYKRGKLHEVFQPSFDWKECRSTRFINQKLSYA